MANMICGAAISHLGGKESLRLDSPRLLEPAEDVSSIDCAARADCATRVRLDLEAGKVELELEMDSAL
jgi:hypothetical protein